MSGSAADRMRIDKWLWHARFCKTRALARALAERGVLRVNGARVEKAGAFIRIGAVLTVPKRDAAIAVRVLSLGERRGPPLEARTLYEVVE